MASLPRLVSDSRDALQMEGGLFPESNSLLVPPNTRKLRHVKSIEIHHQTARLASHQHHNNFADDTMVMPKQRLSKVQSKSTYNLQKSKSETRRVVSSTAAGLLIGKDEVEQNQLDLQQRYMHKYHDSFYTLNHFMDSDCPFFISRMFDPYSTIEDPIDIRMNNTSFTVNVYVKTNHVWILQFKYHIKMSLLICIGDDLDAAKVSKNFSNTIILKLYDDCYYTLPSDDLSIVQLKKLQSDYFEKANKRLSSVRIREKTCSYDQTMKLNNYSRCIHDLVVNKRLIEDKISQLLKVELNNSQHEQILSDSNRLRFQIHETFDQFQDRKIVNHDISQRLAELKQVASRRLLSLENSMSHIDSSKLLSLKEKTEMLNKDNQQVIAEINVFKAKIGEALLFVFPIKESKAQSGILEFELFNIKLPSSLSISYPVFRSIFANGTAGATKVELIQRLSQLSTLNNEKLNAIIGMISFIISKFASMMSIPLTYPIRFLGSHSYIRNPISDLKSAVRDVLEPVNIQTRPPENTKSTGDVYPLFTGHNISLSVRFVYSLILLKKDLAQLFASEQLSKTESFNLLASLKIFFTCISSYQANSTTNSTPHKKAVWISTLEESDPTDKTENSASPSSLAKTSKNVQDFNQHIHSEEMFKAVKDQLRFYANGPPV